MGKKAEYKRRFLEQHPICCFCGGEIQATTIDHIPSRTIFDGRQWPETYEFPACEKCNAASRGTEIVISALSRIFPNPDSEEKRVEMQKAVKGLVNNRPEVAEEMQPTLEQRARHPHALNIGTIIDTEIRLFGQKLGLALHYKHSGQIIPHSGGIAIPAWYTNADQMEGKIPPDLEDCFIFQTEIRRQRTSLDRQFNYRYTITDDGKLSAYLVTFRFAFMIAIYAASDKQTLLDISATEILAPYRIDTNT